MIQTLSNFKGWLFLHDINENHATLTWLRSNCVLAACGVWGIPLLSVPKAFMFQNEVNGDSVDFLKKGGGLTLQALHVRRYGLFSNVLNDILWPVRAKNMQDKGVVTVLTGSF